ncbi:FtsX-like permease family protein [Agromyces aurantiacus]|uniref:FtsX-like permease family protein n=1 Tax=Agromyces aurantiacus TaxID=165814 RepID=A0ABV9RAJ3_9MICO|nr:FtsX-like permease family protein [Agromyces aurantiacus]MBM7504654.1 putative ABC transport system permease protein [Agromyces aurantiacus]
MIRRLLAEHGPTVLVATLASAFGVALLQVTGYLGSAIRADDVTGESGTAAIMLQIAAWVFIVIAIYVSAVVTSNTVATVVAGRTRLIALLRLIGSSARAQRAAIAREGLVVGAIGAVAGVLVGTGAAIALSELAIATDVLPRVEHQWADAAVLPPAIVAALTTWLAAWVGSRRVLAVRPAQALGNATESSRDELAARHGRTVAAGVLAGVGVLLLLGGVALGLVTPLGVLVGLLGGVLSFTGVVLGAHVVMPPVLRLVGRALGSSAPARLAAENAVRHPERSSRMTIGLVIGVTLVTMFAVAMESYRTLLLAATEDRPEMREGIDEIIAGTVSVFSILVGFSALIAAIGLVNTLSLSVLQRTRELGLLRALGFERRQLRAMVIAEAAALTAAATVTGLVLGVFYGWAGAQSMLGSVQGEPLVILPSIPWGVVAALVGAAAVLTVVASLAPARRATRVSPVTALAVE